MTTASRQLRAWRSQRTVLVADSQTLGSLGVIRSLGRAGYRVHAISSDPHALGLRSRYAARSELCPPYGDPKMAEWVVAYVRQHSINAIVPSEAFLLNLRGVHDQLGSLYPYGPDSAVLFAGMSKYDFFAACLARPELREHLPPTILIDEGSSTPDLPTLTALGTPLFVKTDTIYATGASTGAVVRCATAGDARAAVERLRAEFRRFIVQGYAPGVGVGAFFVVWQGRSLGEFTHIRVHEVPHTGGWSSFRRAFTHEAIMDDARARLLAMRWQGPAMVEYRFDEATGRFSLMEMNGRFWGSLHLALYAGVDFPTLLLDAFFGRESTGVVRGDANTASRYTYPAEVQHVASRIADSDVSLAGKLATVAKFLALAANPRVHSDLWFPGDRWLYMIEMRRFFRDASRRIAGRND